MAHSFLSPSAAHRWLNCPAAPSIEAKIPDSGSDFALEGTRAHLYAAAALYDGIGMPATAKDLRDQADAIDSIGDKAEMLTAAEFYKDIVLDYFAKAVQETPDAELKIEVELDLSRVVAPDTIGTGDAVIIADGKSHIIDFKYGKGVRVEARDNPQMQLYALGVIDRYCPAYDIKNVNMVIVQPRLGHVDMQSKSVDELTAWQKSTVLPAATEATGNHPHTAAGDHCRFCKARTRCPRLAAVALTTLADASQELTPEIAAKLVLPFAPTASQFFDKITEYFLHQAMEGVHIPGYKVGRARGRRIITDADRLTATLRAEGYADEEIFAPRTLKTITALDSLVGKSKLAKLAGDTISMSEGKPKLVPDTPDEKDYNDLSIYLDIIPKL